jgi:hypothetical protein
MREAGWRVLPASPVLQHARQAAFANTANSLTTPATLAAYLMAERLQLSTAGRQLRQQQQPCFLWFTWGSGILLAGNTRFRRTQQQPIAELCYKATHRPILIRLCLKITTYASAAPRLSTNNE